MLAVLRELGLDRLPWTQDLQQWRARVTLMRNSAPTPGEAAEWPDVSNSALLATLEDWLAPWLDGVTRREHLSRVDLRGALHGLLDWNVQRRLDEWAPTHLTVPSGSRIAVDYSGAAPSLAVRLQEVFGWMESPRLAREGPTVLSSMIFTGAGKAPALKTMANSLASSVVNRPVI